MEPRIRKFTVIRHHDAARIVYGAAHAIVHGIRIVRLRFLHIGRNIRIGVLRFLFGNELHRIGSGEDRLRL